MIFLTISNINSENKEEKKKEQLLEIMKTCFLLTFIIIRIVIYYHNATLNIILKKIRHTMHLAYIMKHLILWSEESFKLLECLHIEI